MTVSGRSRSDRPLRVLVLHWGRTASGPALTCRIADSLARRPDMRVGVSYSTDAEIVAAFESLRIPSLPVATWKDKSQTLLAFARLPITIVRLVAFLRRYRIDVVLVPMDQVLQSLATWSFQLGGARYVHCLHDGRLHLGESSRLHAILRRIHLRPADRVVVFSEAVRQIAIDEWGFAPESVSLTHLPPIIGRDEVAGVCRHLPEGREVLLGMFGRVVAYKGFDLTVEAARILRDRGYPVSVQLVGRGVADILPERESWLQLEDRWVDDSEVIDVIRRFDVLMLPYREASQSGVLTEAMALGVPVVATPVGGLSSQVVEAGAGVVASEVTAEAVADAVAEMLDDPARYARISAQEISSAEGRFGWSRFIDNLASALRADERGPQN